MGNIRKALYIAEKLIFGKIKVGDMKTTLFADVSLDTGLSPCLIHDSLAANIF